MRFRTLLATVLVCCPALLQAAVPQTPLSVDQVLAFVRSSIKMKLSDKDVAAYLKKVTLNQKLDDRTIEELQGNGLGPKSLTALKELRDTSEKLPEPVAKIAAPKPVGPPPPSYDEQLRVLEEVRQYALNYTKTLPDFICTQVTRRYVDPYGTESWHLVDTLTAKLTYFEQKEKYQLMLVNNTVTDKPFESVSGATSSGEFGSLLRGVFEKDSDAEFHWERWTTLGGRRAHVYNYRVEQGNSRWMIDYERREQITPAYRGLVYVDKATNMVLRLTLEAVDLPASFPVQRATTLLRYDFTKIGDQEFLLPLLAEVRMKHDKYLIKNDVEFRLYRKFGTETNIKFDTPAPLPDEKIKEEHPK
ncbi:MAG: hypothetical protein M3Y07_12890 [Acidobacteriota bacterium]|nr:hypothetical protein [Acidobacteriota bacterium]